MDWMDSLILYILFVPSEGSLSLGLEAALDLL